MKLQVSSVLKQKAILLRKEAEMWESLAKSLLFETENTPPSPKPEPSYPKYDSNKLLNGNETSEYLNISVKTLPIWRVKGVGPRYIKIGRMVRYRVSALDEYINSRTKRNTGQ